MFLFGADVVSAHVLPARPRMTMQESQACAQINGFHHCPLEITRLKARISMDMPFAGFWQYQAVEERGFPAVAGAGVPRREAQILLMVGADQMGQYSLVNFATNGDAQ
jgi:hypothetical protein